MTRELTAADVIKDSILVGRAVHFVYCLILQDEIVYIGKASHAPHARVRDHLYRGIEFDRVTHYGPFDTDGDALREETELIRRFHPKHNKAHCCGPRLVSAKIEPTKPKRTRRRLPPPWQRYGYASPEEYKNNLKGLNKDGTPVTQEHMRELTDRLEQFIRRGAQ